MKHVATHLCIASSIALGCLVTLTPTTAQIVPDNTLPVNSSVTPGCTFCVIDGGTVRGTNLFHSFSEFSVPTDGLAFFNNAEQIQNILTRVTGNEVSNIDGLMSANGTANLFLLNPNGIRFGENAIVILWGSFVASTANSLVFADGTVFNAKPDISTPPLLTISVPLGLQYGSNPGNVQVQGAFLGLGVSQTLALVGSNVSLEGGQILAPGWRVELGGLAGEGTVELVDNGEYLGLSFPDGVPRGDVSLSNGTQVNVRAGGGGSIGINARNLTMTQGSQLLAGIASGRGSVDAKAGNIEINATGVIDLTDGSMIKDYVGSRAQGQGGDINITASQLRLSGGSQVLASTSGQGNGGNLTVNASKEVQLIGTSADGQIGSGLFAQATQGSSGKPGDVTINTDTLLVRDGALVSTSTFGEGDGGNLTVNASQQVQLIGESADGEHASSLSAEANESASGQAGDLTINTGSLLVRDGARVSTITNGEGDGGNLTVNASQQVQLIGESADGELVSGLYASAQPGASGKAGDLTINTDSLLVRDGAQVTTSTFGEGDGGNLTVNAHHQVQVIGTSADGEHASALRSQANRGASGKAGDLTINTDSLLVQDGAQVSTSTRGKGDGGNLTVNAHQQVQVIGTSADGELVSGLYASALPGANGKAGDLTINTDSLLVRDGAQVGTGTFGEGDGGNLTVNASKYVLVIGTSADGQATSSLSASAEPGSSGKAGDLTINTGTLLVRDGAQVSASTWGEGEGGNLTVNAHQQVQLIGTSTDGQAASGLFASAQPGSSGKAGDLTINTGILLVLDGADVSASPWGKGDGGNLTVNASKYVLVIGQSADGEYASGLFAEAQPGSSGKAGELTINTDTLLVGDGAQVGAGTWGEGDGGNLTVNASKYVLVIGESADGRGPSGLFAQSDRGASGKAGDLTINTGTLLVGNGAVISVRSFQGQAGNMTIRANSVFLNQGRLIAETAKSDAQGGANITLSGLDLLRMDNESLISASALGNANGGNVTIDSTLIVATPPTGTEGSDIIANAFQGNGGRVNITTQGMFGIEFRPQRTPKNDITVSSTYGISGEYTLNTPGVDPSRGLSNLPSGIIDASNQIVQNCRAVRGEGGEENKFIITGRGGLPPSPNEPLRNEEVITPDWVTLDSEVETNTSPTPTPPKSSTPEPLTEANGWIINEKGQVELIAAAPNVTPHVPWQPPVNCRQVSQTDSQ
jgi:filamentous hemagglutinin family protein